MNTIMNIKSIIFTLICLFSFSSLSQQLNRMVLENWSDGAWENTMQQLPTYDDDGRILKNEVSHWNAELKVWENRSKTVCNRDENGILLNRETFDWQQDQSLWEATNRFSYSTNDQNKPINALYEERNEKGWYNKFIDENTYDSNGNLIQKQRERWDKQLMAWVPERKFDYTIQSNQRAGYTIYLWDKELEKWEEYKKAAFHFSEAKAVESISYYSWENGSWKQTSVRRNILNEEGVLSAMEVDNFDFESEAWSKISHVDYERTDFNKVSESTHKIWDDESSKWEKLQRSTFSYSEEGEMMEELSQEVKEMELFPNPAKENLTIRTVPVGKLTIVDALGKTMIQFENAEKEIQLDVSEWEAGMYSVQVDGNEVQEFIKQ